MDEEQPQQAQPRRKPSTRAQRARSALAQAHARKDPEAIAECRRNLAVANLEQAIEREVAKAPPLTSAQQDHLVLLIAPGRRQAAADQAVAS